MAAEILKINEGEEPSEYSNHVLIRLTRSGNFQVSGASNNNKLASPEHLTGDYGDLAKALRIGVAWADQRGIRIVHAIL